MADEPAHRTLIPEGWRRPALAIALLAAAAVASAVVLVLAIVRKGGSHPGLAAAAVITANAVFCALFGRLLRLRLLALAATFTVAALTEAALLRSIRSGGNTQWISLVAVAGVIVVGGAIYALRRPRR